MSGLKRRMRGGLALITTAMAVVTGLPHYHCRCPDGRVKLFCLGFPLASGCCCGSSCSKSGQPTPSASEGECQAGLAHQSCCLVTEQSEQGADRPGVPATAEGGNGACVKTLAPPSVVGSNGERCLGDRLAVVSFASPDIIDTEAPHPTRCAVRVWSPPPVPPPDLVTVLHRLVI
jgi:hypothetical protein